ncbi:hypothetical protein EDB85DRAFT_765073 [Lactarius pseudohatsudake]|nr:hypothetical protein EDB85DRAFT_765073 [Lactarius pseudohatsudake]
MRFGVSYRCGNKGSLYSITAGFHNLTVVVPKFSDHTDFQNSSSRPGFIVKWTRKCSRNGVIIRTVDGSEFHSPYFLLYFLALCVRAPLPTRVHLHLSVRCVLVPVAVCCARERTHTGPCPAATYPAVPTSMPLKPLPGLIEEPSGGSSNPPGTNVVNEATSATRTGTRRIDHLPTLLGLVVSRVLSSLSLQDHSQEHVCDAIIGVFFFFHTARPMYPM